MSYKGFLFMMILAALTFYQSGAQNGKGNGSDVMHRVESSYWLPVYCDGVQVDDLFCTTEALVVNHYKSGEWVSSIMSNKGTAISLVTGESFKMTDLDKITITDDQDPEGTAVDHVNLIGDQGSHYVASLTYEWPSWVVTGILKAVCPGKDK